MSIAKALRPAIFLDRDGTLNIDPGYLSSPDQMKLIPGVAGALAKLKAAGFLLVIVSNQSGVGRGKIARTALPLIHAELERQILAEGGAVPDHYELCFHRPDENCACRKPGTAMITTAAQQLNIDLSRSIFVGDRETDLQCGMRAKLRAVALVKTGDGVKTQALLAKEPHLLERKPDFTGADLAEVAHWILSLKLL